MPLLLPIALALSLTAQALQFQYPAPAAGAVVAMRDVEYGAVGGTTLKMDVYRPGGDAAVRRPVLIFFNRATGADRSGDFYRGWAQTAASKGVVGILPDLRDGTQAQELDALLAHLAARGQEYGIDASAIAVYAASGNAWAALPVLHDPARTAVRAAVIYYGGGDVKNFRLDLPMLWVRAGLDRPDLNRDITRLVALAVTQNAPVTLLNYAGGYHGFEARNPGAATRDVIDETIDFVKRTTSAGYQESLRENLTEARAAGYVLAGNHRAAADLYATLVAKQPDAATMRLAYGEALLGAGDFAAACGELEKLKGKGLGYRDLGLPAARACMQKGDADAAIAWLMSIPHRFLPQSVAAEPVFASIKDRADFKAVFLPR